MPDTLRRYGKSVLRIRAFRTIYRTMRNARTYALRSGNGSDRRATRPIQAPANTLPAVVELVHSREGPAPAMIGAQSRIKGEVTGRNNLYVDGEIEGTVELPGNDVVVQKLGRIKGNITARCVMIGGAVWGDIEAREKVSIKATGRVLGQVTSPSLVMEAGSILNGQVVNTGGDTEYGKTAVTLATASP